MEEEHGKWVSEVQVLDGLSWVIGPSEAPHY